MAAEPDRYGEVVHDENDTEYWDRVKENSAGVRELLVTFPNDTSHLMQEAIARGEAIQAVIPVQEALRDREEKRLANLEKARASRASKKRSTVENPAVAPKEVTDENKDTVDESGVGFADTEGKDS